MKQVSRSSFLVTVVLLSILAVKAVSQTKVTLSFKNKQFVGESVKGLESIHLGDYFQVEVDSINLNLYKIAIGKVDTSFAKALSVPSFTGFGSDDLAKLLTSIKTFTSGSTKKIPLIALYSPYDEKDLEDWEKSHANKKASGDDIGKLIDINHDLLNERMKKLVAEKKGIATLVDKVNADLLTSRVATITGDINFQTDALKINEEFSNHRSSLLELEQDIKSLSDRHELDTRPFVKVFDDEKSKGLKENYTKLRLAFTEFLTMIAKAATSISVDSTFKLVNTLIDVQNNKSTSFTSLPLQFSKEQTKITINITPRDEKSLLSSYGTELVFPLGHNQFFGVSSGFYFSWLRNESYSTKKDTLERIDSTRVDTLYRIVDEQTPYGEIGINAMLRFGCRINGDLFFQLGCGPAVSVSDKVRPRLMAGGGIAYGDKHKFLIDAGIAGGYVDRLSEAYSLFARYAQKSDQPTVSKFDTKWYLSFSYLFDN